MKTTCERFLDYVRWNTMSDENSQTVPSTPGQMDFAKYLAEELKTMGIEDVRLDEKGYIYGSIPSNVEKQVPVIGFLAHVDTSEAHPSVTKMPRVIENYDGGRITLESGMVLDPEKDESLSACSGQTLLVTDGYTLLGGDDKAGVAEIVTALEYLLHHPEVKHGKVHFPLHRMRKSALARTTLTWRPSAPGLPIQWMVAVSAASAMKTSLRRWRS